MPETLKLIAGKLRLTVNPAVGGAIQSFEWAGSGEPLPILRRCDGPLGTALAAASFPLVPYVNRIRGGSFNFRGREIRIASNMSGDPSPLHGQGWLNPWQIEHQDERRAVLRFRHEAGEWPWAYQARQEFVLDGDGLTITLDCQNLSDDPMPCGLGQHPYFPCGGATRLDTAVTDVWTIDEHVLPVEKVPAQGRYALTNRLVCGQDMDHGFGGWGGEARMTDPAWPFALRMTSPDARFFQLYSPAAGSIFVAEPVSHANAALNAPEQDWAALGMRVLDRGAEMRLTMRLDVIPA